MSSQSIAILCDQRDWLCRKNVSSLLDRSFDYTISFLDEYSFGWVEISSRFDNSSPRKHSSRMLIYEFGGLEYRERRECIWQRTSTFNCGERWIETFSRRTTPCQNRLNPRILIIVQT